MLLQSPSLTVEKNRLSYADQLTKKHEVNTNHLSNIKRQLMNLPDLSKAGKEQIAWAFEK
jgi:hypothetical protein